MTNDITSHSERTLFKVHARFKGLGLDDACASAFIQDLLNNGILFREPAEQTYEDQALRHQALDWAATTANGSFLHPDLVIERAEQFIHYVKNGLTSGIAGEVQVSPPHGEGVWPSTWTRTRTDDFQLKARKLVYQEYLELFANDSSPIEPPEHFSIDHVYVVWFSKTLQNWKALVSTTIDDGFYWEVTYDGDQHHAYIDRYVKLVNRIVRD